MTILRRAEVATHSPAETEHLGELIGRAARPGDLLALWGELGSGKTTLVRGIARGLGIAHREVISPTFVVMREHEGGRLPLAHVDLYRLAPSEAASTGWEDALEAGGVMAIEWPDRVASQLPADRLDVRLANDGGDERRLELEPTGSRAARLLDEALR